MAKDIYIQDILYYKVRGDEENTFESSLEISFTMAHECMHIGLIASWQATYLKK